MFRFLRKKKIIVPDDYKNLISQTDYKTLIEQCLDVLQKLEIEVISHANGDIVYKGKNDKESHYFLDNLVRRYVQTNEKDKYAEVEAHFKKLQETPHSNEYLFKDYDYAKQFLKVLVKPTDIAPKIEDFVTRVDYPNLLTVLVLDFEERFHYIRKDEADLWGVDYDDLFKVALNNISQEDIDVRKHLFDDRFDVFVLLSGNFSASISLLISSHLDFAIGKHGSLIGLPTKGTAFIHPITRKDVMDLTTSLYHEMEKFYDEDPGNISMDFYWYDNKGFQMFDSIWNDDGTLTISMPEDLKILFNNK